MKLSQLRPKSNQRMLITGASGSGKTTLARQILLPYPRVLVIDPKCTYGGSEGEPGYRMVRSPRELRGLPKRLNFIQYRPEIQYNNVYGYNEVYEWAYRRGDIVVYTDEAFQVHRGSFAPDYLRHCLTSGRELGVGMILASQRPRGIDLRVMTEAEVLVMFKLRHRDDKKRMAEFMGEEVMRKLPEFAFWYVRDGMEHPIVARIALPKNGE